MRRPARGGRLIFATALLLAMDCRPWPDASAPEPEVIDLLVGSKHDLDFSDGDRMLRSRLFYLRAGEYLYLTAEQLGVDVELILSCPDGDPLTVDSPTENQGFEHLHLIAEKAGVYQLDVKAFKGRGRVALRVMARRNPTPTDAIRAEAVRAESQGRRLADQRRPDAKPGDSLAAAGQFRRAAEDWIATGDVLFAARAHFAAGKLLFEGEEAERHLGRARTAADHFSAARKLAGRAAYEPLATDALLYLGRISQGLGLDSEARIAFEEVIELNHELGREKARATAMNELALHLQRLGELFHALELFDGAIDIFEDLERPCHLAPVKANLGGLYSRLGAPRNARVELRAALVALERGSCLEGELRPAIEARLGDALLALDRRGRAFELHRRALTRYHLSGNVIGEALALNSLGHVLADAGHLTEALELYREASDVYRGAGRLRFWATAWRGACRMWERLGRWEKAEPCFRRISEHTTARIRTEIRASAHFGLARLAHRRGERALALAEIDVALGHLEGLWDDLGSLAASSRANKQSYYEFRIDLLAETHRGEPRAGHDVAAFATSERARAQSLLEILSPGVDEFLRGIDPDRAATFEELRTEINRLDRGRRKGPGVDAELGRKLARQSLIKEALRREHPRHGETVERFPPVGLETMRREILDEDTLLVQYHLGEDRSHLWAVSQELKHFWSDLPGRGALERASRRTRHRLESGGTVADGAELGHMVLGPMAPLLSDYRRLLIVADGALLEFPFAALPHPAHHDQPLAESHQIVYAPSSTVLATLRSRGRGSADGEIRLPFLGLGDAVFHDLERLPGSRAELEAVRRHFAPGTAHTLYGFDVRRELFENGLVGHYRILHVASHGVVDDLNPGLSAVMLSSYDSEGRRIDGRLRAYEIATFEIGADLVVLSACDTGRGLTLPGEGVAGLARAFLTAGAERLLVSLWRVEDEATARLMDFFYGFLIDEGLAPPEALRRAQLALYQDGHGTWALPYYWAGFVLQGEPGPRDAD